MIVCDLQMPVLDGPAFYAILAWQYPALRQRVIFLTGDTGGGGQHGISYAMWPPMAAQALPHRGALRRAIQDVLQASPPL